MTKLSALNILQTGFKTLSIKQNQRCGLGLDVSVSRRIFLTSRSRRNVGTSRSRSRLGLKVKRLGLGLPGLVYKWQFSHIFKANLMSLHSKSITIV